MNKFRLIFLAFISVTFSFPQIIEASNPSTSVVIQNSLTITGCVIDKETGTRLAGAKIYVVLDKTVIGTETNSDGKYTLKGVQPGVIVYCYFPGYKLQAIQLQGKELNFALEVEV